MARRIEIELTSARPDGTWTWRVAGAKQPKGVLDGALLPATTKVGDVLRADAEFELEGTVITAVVAPPEKRAPDLLTFVTDSRPFEGVTTSLVPKSPRRERSDGPGDRRPRGDGPSERRGRPDSRPSRTDGRPPAKPEAPRPAGRRPERPRVDNPAAPRPAADKRDERRAPARPRRFNPGSVHRTAVLESLAPEERAVAEQILNGGVPAVRRALQEQNARAKEEGRPEIKADALLVLAEQLLPRLKAAEWRDRAEAAVKEADQLSLRDLRSVVAGADAGARDDDSRILAKTLREQLDGREAAERDTWIAEVTTCLDEGQVARALRVAGRPPDPRTRFPAELSTRLAELASEAMSPDTSPDRWGQLLGALLESPVRRAVKPRGLPPEPGEVLLSAARQAAGRVPALAPLLGLPMPPPPGPPRGTRRPPMPPPRRSRPAPRPPQEPPVSDVAPHVDDVAPHVDDVAPHVDDVAPHVEEVGSHVKVEPVAAEATPEVEVHEEQPAAPAVPDPAPEQEISEPGA